MSGAGGRQAEAGRGAPAPSPASPASPALSAYGLVKAFDADRAVDGVDLVVAPGEVRGLLGPNGAGKTTLLRMLFGLVRPDAGEVSLFGRPLLAADPNALDGVAGFVETPAFYPYLSGRVNLELLAELDDRGASARIDDALAQVMLAERADDRVSAYSTGMRQRLGIAAALVRAPRLLLLDEPTSGLDPAGVRDVGALLRGLACEGVAVLLSSHQIVEVEAICDSFTVLRRGREVWSGSVASLRDQAPAIEYRLITSDDNGALEVARDHRGVRAIPSPSGGLQLEARPERLDPYVVDLGRRSIAIRGLKVLVGPLEAMFFALTGERPGPEPDDQTVQRMTDDLISDGR